MSQATKHAGIDGTFQYTLNVVPDETPHLVIYSDQARTVVAVADQVLATTTNPARFTASYPASLVAGTYYLSFSTVITTGDPAFVDENDTLLLVSLAGNVGQQTGPCEPWTSTDDMCEPCSDYSFPAGLLDEMIDVASDLLYVWSGSQYSGECEAILRPCSPCGHQTKCGCTPPQIRLGPFPITEISEVLIDGEVLDPSHYRLDESRYLVRLRVDGRNPGWPSFQRMDLPTTEDETFQVTVKFGQSVPLAGAKAAAALACQLALSCDPDTVSNCVLPKRVTNLVRQGVTVALDNFGFLPVVRTAIYEVDAFLSAVNPNDLRGSSEVFSPDLPDAPRIMG